MTLLTGFYLILDNGTTAFLPKIVKIDLRDLGPLRFMVELADFRDIIFKIVSKLMAEVIVGRPR